jgi:hypothetical protein
LSKRGEGGYVGTHGRPGLVHRRLLHLLEAVSAHLRHPRQYLGEPAVPAEGRGYERHAPYAPGVLNGAAQAGAGTERVAEQVRLAKTELLDQTGDVVAERLVAEGPVDVAGVTVALQLNGDDATVRRQPLEQISELARQPEASVHNHERGSPGPATLPVQLDAIHRRVPGRTEIGHLLGPLGVGHHTRLVI